MHLVICSHLLRDIEETCQEVLILKQGRIVHYSNLEQERSSNRRFVELEAWGEPKGFVEALNELGCETTPAAAGGSFESCCRPDLSCARFTVWLRRGICNCGD